MSTIFKFSDIFILKKKLLFSLTLKIGRKPIFSAIAPICHFCCKISAQNILPPIFFVMLITLWHLRPLRGYIVSSLFPSTYTWQHCVLSLSFYAATLCSLSIPLRGYIVSSLSIPLCGYIVSSLSLSLSLFLNAVTLCPLSIPLRGCIVAKV